MSAAFKQRKRLIARRDGGYRCAYCGVPSTRKDLTVDHVVPRSRGGSWQRHNLVLACLGCNDAKADSVGGVYPWIPRTALWSAVQEVDES